MIGGFYRTTEGVKCTQFPADDGGQLTASITRKLDQGELSFYARTTDDKNAFYTPVPRCTRPTMSRRCKAFPVSIR